MVNKEFIVPPNSQGYKLPHLRTVVFSKDDMQVEQPVRVSSTCTKKTCCSIKPNANDTVRFFLVYNSFKAFARSFVSWLLIAPVWFYILLLSRDSLESSTVKEESNWKKKKKKR